MVKTVIVNENACKSEVAKNGQFLDPLKRFIAIGPLAVEAKIKYLIR